MINNSKKFINVGIVVQLLSSLIILLFLSFYFLDNIVYMLFSKNSIMFKQLLINSESNLPWLFSEKSLEFVIAICLLLLFVRFLMVFGYKSIYKFVFILLSFFCLVEIKDYLKYLFGRCVPSICSKFNLVIGSEQFHWFAGGGIFGSFPSGHCSLLSFFIVWLYFTYPKYKNVLISFLGCVVVLLIVSGYHFLSDCIAGLLVGISFGLSTQVMWFYMEQIIVSKMRN